MCFGQKIADKTYKYGSFSLPDSTLIRKSIPKITLLETDNILIVTTRKLFFKNLKDFINVHEIDSDINLLNSLKNSKSDNLIPSQMKLGGLTLSRLKYRTADLIKEGKCLVYNKETKRLERKGEVISLIRNNYTSDIYKSNNKVIILRVGTGAF